MKQTKFLLPIFALCLFAVASRVDGATSIDANGMSGTGALTLQPASGSNLNITLATTGDLVVNTNQLYVDTSTGYVGIGDATPSAALDISKSYNSSADDDFSLLTTTGTYSGSITDFASLYGLKLDDVTLSAGMSGSGNGQVFGMYANPTYTGTTNNGAISMYGGYYDVIYAGTVGTNDGVYMYGDYIYVSGNPGTDANSIKYGVYAEVDGTADTHYGLFSYVTGATTNYGLYVATGKSYFGGDIGIGLTTNQTGSKLEVKDGHIASSQTTAPTTGVTGTGYSGASLAAGSTDTKGKITATVGAAAGTLVVTFNSAYATAPTCTVSPATATAQVDSGKMYVTASTTALTLNFVATPTGGSETWNYICLQ